MDPLTMCICFVFIYMKKVIGLFAIDESHGAKMHLKISLSLSYQKKISATLEYGYIDYFLIRIKD